MKDETKSFLLDFVQGLSLLIIVLNGPLIPSNSVLLLLQILAVVILFVSIYEMRRVRYYRLPDVGKPNELVKTGIYKYIRNPMYLSQLLFAGVLVTNSYSVFRLGVLLIFFVNFLFKISYEEKLLATYFKEFENYKKSSWRLIPYIF